MATLGGFAFIRDGVKYDYCFEQSIESLCQCCDQVSIAYIRSGENPDDGTDATLLRLEEKFDNLWVHVQGPLMWGSMVGKQKLSNFQNIAAMCLNMDYQLLIQADEIIHPNSYSSIREAIETGAEGFLCERINLWGTPNHMLTVPLERQPCSVSVVRLTKRGYWCYDDGENIGVPHPSTAFYDKIKIVHYGFVRKKEVMKAKIINMQEGVFAMGSHDAKLDQCDIFDSKLWFDGEDLAPINFTHPPIMNQWVLDRM